MIIFLAQKSSKEFFLDPALLSEAKHTLLLFEYKL